jgi:hypothetical protein
LANRIKADGIVDRQVILSKTASGNNTWLLEINPVDFKDGIVNFFLNTGGSAGTGSNFGSTTAVAKGAWQHVACVYDGKNRHLYRNASLAHELARLGALVRRPVARTSASSIFCDPLQPVGVDLLDLHRRQRDFPSSTASRSNSTSRRWPSRTSVPSSTCRARLPWKREARGPRPLGTEAGSASSVSVPRSSADLPQRRALIAAGEPPALGRQSPAGTCASVALRRVPR